MSDLDCDQATDLHPHRFRPGWNDSGDIENVRSAATALHSPHERIHVNVAHHCDQVTWEVMMRLLAGRTADAHEPLAVVQVRQRVTFCLWPIGFRHENELGTNASAVNDTKKPALRIGRTGDHFPGVGNMVTREFWLVALSNRRSLLSCPGSHRVCHRQIRHRFAIRRDVALCH